MTLIRFCAPIFLIAGLASPASAATPLLLPNTVADSLRSLDMDSLKIVAAIAASIDSVVPSKTLQTRIDSIAFADQAAMSKRKATPEDMQRVMGMFNPTEETKANRVTERAQRFTMVLNQTPRAVTLVKRGKLSVESYTRQYVRVSLVLDALRLKTRVDSAGGDGDREFKLIVAKDIDFVKSHEAGIRALEFPLRFGLGL